jgi:hypothetical protein
MIVGCLHVGSAVKPCVIALIYVCQSCRFMTGDYGLNFNHALLTILVQIEG